MKTEVNFLNKLLDICLIVLFISFVHMQLPETKFQTEVESFEQFLKNRKIEIDIIEQFYELESVKSELRRIEDVYFTHKNEIDEYCNQRDSSLCEYVMDLEIERIINSELKLINLPNLMEGIKFMSDETEVTIETQLRFIKSLVGYCEYRRDDIYKEIEAIIGTIGTANN